MFLHWTRFSWRRIWVLSAAYNTYREALMGISQAGHRKREHHDKLHQSLRCGECGSGHNLGRRLGKTASPDAHATEHAQSPDAAALYQLRFLHGPANDFQPLPCLRGEHDELVPRIRRHDVSTWLWIG